MDREDARFVANALESRINGARAELERLAASSLMPLSAIATTISRRNAPPARWAPATVAADELMAICREGGKLADVELSADRRADLEAFIASMRKLAGEQPLPVNRLERRARASAKFKLAKRAPLVSGVKPLEILP